MTALSEEKVLRINCPGFGVSSTLPLGEAKPLAMYDVIVVNPISVLHLFDSQSEHRQQIEMLQSDGMTSFRADDDSVIETMIAELDIRSQELHQFLKKGGLLVFFLVPPFVLQGPNLSLDNYTWLGDWAPDKPTSVGVRNMSATIRGKTVEPSADALQSIWLPFLKQSGMEWSTIIRLENLNDGYQPLATAGPNKCISAFKASGPKSGQIVFLPAPYVESFDGVLKDALMRWYAIHTDDAAASAALQSLSQDLSSLLSDGAPAAANAAPPVPAMPSLSAALSDDWAPAAVPVGTPVAPAVPAIPEVPAVPAMPEVPAAPAMSEVPAAPAMPAAALPTEPAVAPPQQEVPIMSMPAAEPTPVVAPGVPEPTSAAKAPTVEIPVPNVSTALPEVPTADLAPVPASPSLQEVLSEALPHPSNGAGPNGNEAQPLAQTAAVPSDPAPQELIRKMSQEISRPAFPDWCAKYSFEELDALRKQHQDVNEEIRLAHIKAQDLQVRIQVLDDLKNSLLASQGEQLVDACTKVFERLGWQVKPAMGTTDELWLVEDDKTQAIVRLIFSTTQPNRSELASLAESVITYWGAHEVEPKGILVASTWADKSPDERPDEDFSASMNEFAKRKNLCLLTTAQLLSIFRDLDIGALNPKPIRDNILSTSGLVSEYVFQKKRDASAALS